MIEMWVESEAWRVEYISTGILRTDLHAILTAWYTSGQLFKTSALIFMWCWPFKHRHPAPRPSH